MPASNSRTTNAGPETLHNIENRITKTQPSHGITEMTIGYRNISNQRLVTRSDHKSGICWAQK